MTIPSKEDILDGYEPMSIQTDYEIYEDLWQQGCVFQAMDEYAKQIAIGFAKWLNEKRYQHSEHPDRLFSYYTEDGEAVPIEQLYNQYLNTLIP